MRTHINLAGILALSLFCALCGWMSGNLTGRMDVVERERTVCIHHQHMEVWYGTFGP